MHGHMNVKFIIQQLGFEYLTRNDKASTDTLKLYPYKLTTFIKNFSQTKVTWWKIYVKIVHL